MTSPGKEQLPLADRIERALVVLALFIELDGDVHIPMYEKFERELAELRRKEATRERARRLVLSYGEAGTLNAERPKNLSLSSSDGPLPYLGL